MQHQVLVDLVTSVCKDFSDNNTLFTALDISHEVKKSLPHARHSEVRNIIRDIFISEIEPVGYMKTNIPVTLADGTVVSAILYHNASDLYDLDLKYDDQKRTQQSVYTSVQVQPVVDLTVSTYQTGPISSQGVPPIGSQSTPTVSTPTSTPMPMSTLISTPIIVPMLPQPPASIFSWNTAFNTVPSLFPLK